MEKDDVISAARDCKVGGDVDVVTADRDSKVRERMTSSLLPGIAR
jgi:hypothetical protein